MREISVLMVGLGRIGGKFYEQFSSMPSGRVKIIGVCETDAANPLLEDAKSKNIATFDSYETAIKEFGSDIDIIMDTSNSSFVKGAIRQLLQETGNQHSVLVPMVVDYLMWYLLPDAEDIEQGHHKNIGY